VDNSADAVLTMLEGVRSDIACLSEAVVSIVRTQNRQIEMLGTLLDAVADPGGADGDFGSAMERLIHAVDAQTRVMTQVESAIVRLAEMSPPTER
jgi:protein-tyrosine-phosphatase